MTRRGGIRRSIGGTRTSGELDDVVRRRLDSDPAWQHFTRDGRWICPYCLTAVRCAQPGRAHLLRAAERHLHSRCPSFQGGAGTYQTEAAIRLKIQYEDISLLATTDPAWQVFDHEGYWYSPASLERVSSVRVQNRRFDTFTIQHMAEHLGQCPHFQRGVLHNAARVQQARDQGARVSQFAQSIRRMLNTPLWRHRDAAGFWICPYCLTHLTTARITNDAELPQAAEAMARHLLGNCSGFSPSHQVLQDEAAVRQAAAAPPPAVSAPTPRQQLGTPSGVYGRIRSPARGQSALGSDLRRPSQGGLPPIATPLHGTPAQGTPPIASPASGRPPIATPVGGNRTIPGKRTSTQLPPIASPARSAGETGTSSRPLPVVPALDPETSGQRELSGHTPTILPKEHSTSATDMPPAEDPLAGSFIDALAGEPERSPLDEDPFSWMEEQHAEEDISPSEERLNNNTEMLRARDVQQGMLREAPAIPGFSFGTRFEAASAVSGDFYEFIQLLDGRIGFAQGDVSGHGMQAGLIMSMAKKVLAIYARQGQDPREVLASVNDTLSEDLGGKMFVTAVYAILDPAERSITWARAGHDPVLHFNRHDRQIKSIKPNGMVLGMRAGKLFRGSITQETTTVRSGDIFLIYTDGLTETMNRQGEEYGTDRLQEVLLQHGDLDLDHLLDRITDSVRSFRGGGEVQDDITLLALAVD